ncbi:multidrug effflux MFS transporter [Paraflavitalea pollutisoli]|uniref:multidrug effflux MFS transporter n=1 Tax=Paraflavitalea pollutisoli TaxID=3034143 RepID=UPI0023EB24BD|nr:multidrug effflux MFS transporter [Paraflavitalea sp. H1-2-19X]
MTKKRYYFLVAILGALTTISPFAIDMYLPGFTAIAKDFDSTVSDVALSLSSFFVGVSVGQLLHGPLMDRYGRKRPLLIALTLFIASSLVCAFSTTLDMFVAVRFVQALGACAATVAANAMVRDLFPVEENAKVFSMLMLILGVSPIVAPTVGSYVTAFLGWPAVFIILAAIAIIIWLFVYFGLPESAQPDHTYSLKPTSITRSYLAVFKEPIFYTYTFTGAIAFAGLFAFLSGSPSIYMEYFSLTDRQYGLVFALLAGGLILASQINRFLLKRYKSEQIISTALIAMTIVGLLLIVVAINHWITLPLMLLLQFLYLSCLGYILPNASARAMSPFSKGAGSASALMGALQMGIGAGVSILLSLLQNGTAMPMVIVMAVCAFIAMMVLMLGSRMIRYKPSQA